MMGVLCPPGTESCWRLYPMQRGFRALALGYDCRARLALTVSRHTLTSGVRKRLVLSTQFLVRAKRTLGYPL